MTTTTDKLKSFLEAYIKFGRTPLYSTNFDTVISLRRVLPVLHLEDMEESDFTSRLLIDNSKNLPIDKEILSRFIILDNL